MRPERDSNNADQTQFRPDTSTSRKPDSDTNAHNDTATTEIYTLSLHDALPIFVRVSVPARTVRSDSRMLSLLGVTGS